MSQKDAIIERISFNKLLMSAVVGALFYISYFVIQGNTNLLLIGFGFGLSFAFYVGVLRSMKLIDKLEELE